MMRKGQWTVLPASLARKLKGIRDKDKPRWHCATASIAPGQSMQFVHALHRILRVILEAHPRFGPVYMCKIDIADGFYRVWLLPADIPKLSVVLPTMDGEEPLISFPLALPMGWVNSPPYFCAATETMCDLANTSIKARNTFKVHPLDDVSETPVPPEPPMPRSCAAPSKLIALPEAVGVPVADQATRLVASHDVYVDDFISIAKGNSKRRREVKRSLFEALDSVFRPLLSTNHPDLQKPASVKKMRKGDGTWATRKLVLGWTLDSVTKTIKLPPHWVELLQDIIASLPRTRTGVSVKNWHKVLGELHSMTIRLPGAQGLFSTLHERLRHPETKSRLHISTSIHDFLDDFRCLAATLHERPTKIAELLPQAPSTIGASDAAKDGMGGVNLLPNPNGTMQPVLWRQWFSEDIVARLVTDVKPTDNLTISDLELAATVAHHDVLVQAIYL
jgi:hypothetical protein